MTVGLERIVKARQGRCSILRPRETSVFEPDSWDEQVFSEDIQGNNEASDEIFSQPRHYVPEQDDVIDSQNNSISKNLERINSPPADKISDLPLKDASFHLKEKQDKQTDDNTFILKQEHNILHKNVQNLVTTHQHHTDHLNVENNILSQDEKFSVENSEQVDVVMSHNDDAPHLDDHRFLKAGHSKPIIPLVHAPQGKTVLNNKAIMDTISVLPENKPISNSIIYQQDVRPLNRKIQEKTLDTGGVHIHIGSIHVRAQEQKKHVAPSVHAAQEQRQHEGKHGAPILEDYLRKQENV